MQQGQSQIGTLAPQSEHEVLYTRNEEQYAEKLSDGANRPVHERLPSATAWHGCQVDGFPPNLPILVLSLRNDPRCNIARLTDKVAIVTGAGTRSTKVAGVGAATATCFAAHGARVLIVDMDPVAAETTRRAIVEAGGQAEVFVADVADESGCQALVQAAIDAFGTIDILMNSVGISGPGMVTDVDEASWQRVLDVDLKSMVFICKYAVPVMAAGGGGSIINVSSVDGMRAGMTRNIPYAAAKGGMIAATRAMAVHHGRDNIRANCIAPGLLYTAMTEQMEPEQRDMRTKLAPLGTEGTAVDVAKAAVFLASDDARWITGVLLPVDAGLMAAGPQSLLDNILDDR